jgi:hypothetical protein
MRVIKDCNRLVRFLRQVLFHSDMGSAKFLPTQIETGARLFGNIAEMQKKAEGIHKELLELISTLSDGTTSDTSSSVSTSFRALKAMSDWMIRFISGPMAHKAGDMPPSLWIGLC